MPHDRPLAATPDATIRRVTEDQMKTLRQARDNLLEVHRCMRSNLEDIEDMISEIGQQVMAQRTE